MVTGASGFIGSHLCGSLRDEGGEVYAISRKIISREVKRISWCEGDLTDYSIMRDLLATIKPNVIFHLAGYATGLRDRNLVIPILNNTLLTTVNLLTAASEIGCNRIVFAGSMEEPRSDNHLVMPSSPYAAAKWASSAYSRMFHALYKLPVVIAQISMVYGPGQKDLNKLVPYVILSILQGKAPKMTSGERLIDWIYVNDVVEGLIAIGCTPGIEGHTIELGSGKLITIREIVQRIFALSGTKIEPLFGVLPDRPLETVRAADIKVANIQMDWRPKTNLDEGIMLTLEWFRENLQKYS